MTIVSAASGPQGVFTVAVKVIPSAPANKFAGRRGEELVFKINAPPADGKANRELISFLASSLGIAKSRIVLSRGALSRHKVITLPLAVRGILSTLFPSS